MKLSYVIITVLVIFFVFFVHRCAYQSDQSDIKSFLSQRSQTVFSSEQHFLNIGPYWVSKNYRIYKVVSSTHETYWFRFGSPFGYDVEKEEGNGHVKLK